MLLTPSLLRLPGKKQLPHTEKNKNKSLFKKEEEAFKIIYILVVLDYII
jgi:hypothetical protein